MLSFLPNAITLINAFAGCVALVFIFQQDWKMALLWIGIGMIADFLDGAIARLLGVSSELGKQLDSLADMITFGVLPGAIMYHLLLNQLASISWHSNWAFIGFVISVAACLRLARFNLDTRQSEHFIGMSTPACTFFVIGLLLLDWQNLVGATYLIQPFVLIGLSFLLSALMLSSIPLINFKFKHFQWQGNQARFILLGISIFLLLVLQAAALVPIIAIYIVLSVLSIR